MGFNPYEKFKATTTDYVLVVIAGVLGAALVAWAFLAG